MHSDQRYVVTTPDTVCNESSGQAEQSFALEPKAVAREPKLGLDTGETGLSGRRGSEGSN